MHRWEDEGVDWEGIEAAADYIGRYCEFWSGIKVAQTKEKWGMACVYLQYGPINKWQELVYRRAYKNAIEKWPHLKEEILKGADWDEFLQGLS